MEGLYISFGDSLKDYTYEGTGVYAAIVDDSAWANIKCDYKT